MKIKSSQAEEDAEFLHVAGICTKAVIEDFGKSSFKKTRRHGCWISNSLCLNENRGTLLHKLKDDTYGIPTIPVFLTSSDEMYWERKRNLGAGRG